MNKKRNNKGITLIALIITIIIILLLAGVSIGIVVNGNLFDRAKDTVGKTNNQLRDQSNQESIIVSTWDEMPGTIIKSETTQMTTANDTVNANDIANATDVTKYYGKTVTGYTSSSTTAGTKVDTIGWKIFYVGPTPGSTTNHIYLIADDYIHYNNAPSSANYTLSKGNKDYSITFGSVGNDYTTGAAAITDTRIRPWLSYLNAYPSITGNNMPQIAFMLDTNRWNTYYKGDAADYAIGGPTLDLYAASYNKYYEDDTTFTGTQTIYYGPGSAGYNISSTTPVSTSSYSVSNLDAANSLYIISSTIKAQYMWIASPAILNPSSVMAYVSNEGYLNGNYASFPSAGIRPIVRLNANVELVKLGDGYKILEN